MIHACQVLAIAMRPATHLISFPQPPRELRVQVVRARQAEPEVVDEEARRAGRAGPDAGVHNPSLQVEIADQGARRQLGPGEAPPVPFSVMADLWTAYENGPQASGRAMDCL